MSEHHSFRPDSLGLLSHTRSLHDPSQRCRSLARSFAHEGLERLLPLPNKWILWFLWNGMSAQALRTQRISDLSQSEFSYREGAQ